MPSRIGLNGLNFFHAAAQAGFGPFIAVWLTERGWSLTQIGLALSIGTFAALLGQLPGGMLVDQIHARRTVAALAMLALGVSAVALCLPPTDTVVWGAEIGHALASCVTVPAIAALTLSVCGHEGFGERLGFNTSYAALGNAAAAALLGAASVYISQRSVFLVTAALVVPAMVALLLIRSTGATADDHPALKHPSEREYRPWRIFLEPALHIFAVAIVLFQLANAALLPLALNELARRGEAPGFVVSATIIVPQIITATVAPWAGKLAQRVGRRPVLIVGFAAIALRSLLFAALPSAWLLVGFQTLDGVSAAVLGLMVPLIAADVTSQTGYLNLAIGALGLAAGLGGTCSTVLAGWIADRLGAQTTFLFLALIGTVATTLMALAMPETRPVRGRDARDAILPA